MIIDMVESSPIDALAERFCDNNCTWLDHHPECDKAEQPAQQEPVDAIDDTDRLAFEVFHWAEATFPKRTDSSMFLKMYSEIAELIRSDGEPLELADLFILLMDYAVRKDIVISAAVRQKLEINRQRTWKINADGTMSHEE